MILLYIVPFIKGGQVGVRMPGTQTTSQLTRISEKIPKMIIRPLAGQGKGKY